MCRVEELFARKNEPIHPEGRPSWGLRRLAL
jgi:hypothetical protein